MNHSPSFVPAATKRNDGLDTLRAVAILLVFMYHYQVFASHVPTYGWFSEVGWVGVDLFFILSGYLIGNQLFAGVAQGQTLSLKAFFSRRLLRTLPNYYVVLALFMLFPAAMGGKTPPPLWRFLSFTQNIGLHGGTAFSHAWSLCVEEQFYVILPLTVVLVARARHAARLAWNLVALGMLAGLVTRCVMWSKFGRAEAPDFNGYQTWVYYSSFCRLDEFLPGVAIAMIKHFHRGWWAQLMRRGRLSFAVGLACTVAICYLLNVYLYVDGAGVSFALTALGYPALAISFAILTLSALSPDSPLYKLRVPGAAKLALWSYAIYLTHKPLAFILHGQLEALGFAADSWAAAAIIAVCALVVGAGLYLLIERPFMRLRDRFFPSNFPDAVAVPAGVAAQG